jgi:hypothetical protein
MPVQVKRKISKTVKLMKKLNEVLDGSRTVCRPTLPGTCQDLQSTVLYAHQSFALDFDPHLPPLCTPSQKTEKEILKGGLRC